MINTVNFTLKGFVEKSYEGIGKLHAFVGEHAAGKTAIKDAILLAATGQHPIGPKSYGQIATASHALWAQITGPGLIGEFELEPKPGAKPRRIVQGVDSLLCTVGDQLQGDRLAREALIARFGRLVEAPALDLSAGELALYETLRGSIDEQIKACRSKVSSLGGTVTKGAEQLAALERDCKDLGGVEMAGQVDRQLAALAKEQQADQDAIEAFRGAQREERGAIARGEMIEFALTGGEERCPLCAADLPEHHRNKILAAVATSRANRELLIGSLETQIREAQARQEERLGRITRGGEIRDRINAAKGAAQTIAKLREQVSAAEEDQRNWKSLGAKLTRIATTESRALAETAILEVAKCMPPGYAPHLWIDSARCQWGVESHGHASTKKAASGMELGVLTIALARAWGGKVLLLDDDELRGVMGDEFTSLTQSLADLVRDPSEELSQVLLFVHSDRAARLPEGWPCTRVDRT